MPIILAPGRPRVQGFPSLKPFWAASKTLSQKKRKRWLGWGESLTFWSDENILKLDYGDGSAALGRY
jgi:hypothetical protein